VRVAHESEPSSSEPTGSGSSPRRPASFGAADASLIGLGTQMVSEVVAGVLIGIGVDYMLDTKGRWVVVGSIGGVIVAMWTIVRVAMRLQAQPRPSLPIRVAPPASRSAPKSKPAHMEPPTDKRAGGES